MHATCNYFVSESCALLEYCVEYILVLYERARYMHAHALLRIYRTLNTVLSRCGADGQWSNRPIVPTRLGRYDTMMDRPGGVLVLV